MIFLITLWLVVVNKFSSEAPEFMWGGWWGGIQTYFHVKTPTIDVGLGCYLVGVLTIFFTKL